MMDIEQRADGFIAGFVSAGGDAEQARERAPQFIACCIGNDYQAAQTIPAVASLVEALLGAFPAPLPTDSVAVPGGAISREAVVLWLEGEALVRWRDEGAVLSEKGYLAFGAGQAAAQPPSYREARRLGNELADVADRSSLTGYLPKLEAFFIAMTQVVGLAGLTELRRAVLHEPVTHREGPWYER